MVGNRLLASPHPVPVSAKLEAHTEVHSQIKSKIIHNSEISASPAQAKMLVHLKPRRSVKEVVASNHQEWWDQRKKELQ